MEAVIWLEDEKIRSCQKSMVILIFMFSLKAIAIYSNIKIHKDPDLLKSQGKCVKRYNELY